MGEGRECLYDEIGSYDGLILLARLSGALPGCVLLQILLAAFALCPGRGELARFAQIRVHLRERPKV